jgi:hypothetical protein
VDATLHGALDEAARAGLHDLLRKMRATHLPWYARFLSGLWTGEEL